jgi:hypothetical protein
MTMTWYAAQGGGANHQAPPFCFERVWRRRLHKTGLVRFVSEFSRFGVTIQWPSQRMVRMPFIQAQNRPLPLRGIPLRS